MIRRKITALTQAGMLRWDGERFVPHISEDGGLRRGKRRVKNSFALFDETGLETFNDGRYQTYNFSDSKIVSLAEDQHGALWIETGDGNLIRFENGRALLHK